MEQKEIITLFRFELGGEIEDAIVVAAFNQKYLSLNKTECNSINRWTVDTYDNIEGTIDKQIKYFIENIHKDKFNILVDSCSLAMFDVGVFFRTYTGSVLVDGSIMKSISNLSDRIGLRLCYYPTSDD